MKSEVIEILDELRDQVQYMREEGDTDLRTVLHRIDSAITKVKRLEDDTEALQMKLTYANHLLSEANGLLDDVHLGDTGTARAIDDYLYGEDE